MKNLMKHFTQITKTASPERDILQTVRFDATTNTVTATDSHRALRYLKDVPVSMNLNPLTLEFGSGEYPNVDRLFSGFKDSAEFEAAQITKALVGKIKKLGSEGLVEMSVTADGLVIGDLVIKLVNYPERLDVTFLIKTKYLVDALDFIADCKLPVPIKLEFISNVCPLKFSGPGFEYLIAPVRPS